jgi:LmbE family N-acetylglucosaminyl deacetylase
MVQSGYEAYTLILSSGITSRSPQFEREKLKSLKEERENANKIVGIKKVFTKDFPDNKFDSIALLDIVKAVEEVKDEINPDIIFTHSKEDLNIDHQITYNAVLTATRPMVGECVREIYTFEILSSSEWNIKTPFIPDVFVNVGDFIGIKKDAMNAYKSELREYPHPRSIEGIELQSKNRGMSVGLEYAEAFATLRRVIDTI